jgi:Tannase and feruloyl esterase
MTNHSEFNWSVRSATILVITFVLSVAAGCPDSFAVGQSGVTSQSACADLVGRRVGAGQATVTKTRIDPATATLPEYCVVTADFHDSGMQVETRLPTSRWNGKLAYLGGGGYNGIIPPFEAKASWSPSILRDHYAVVLSNGGYFGPNLDEDPTRYFEAAFAQDPMKLVDFMFLSVHRALPIGKDIVQSYYSRQPDRSYFEGCSGGGHEAMIEAQRFPNDFDGIIARAPAANFVGLLTNFNRIARQVSDSQNDLSPAKRTTLAKAVLAECDKLDGLEDGIISRPGACHFKPETLRCPNGGDTGDSCLSDRQIATINRVTQPYSTRDGSVTHAGFNFGGEDQVRGWGDYIWPAPQWGAYITKQGGFSNGFIRGILTQDPNFDTMEWNPDDWLPTLHVVSRLLQSYDPNLSAMVQNGSKLIMWNGEMDTAVSPRDSARYYDNVVAKLGQESTDKVLEYFPAPGVGHCQGGVGPDHIDLMQAMATWVERGKPPSKQNLALTKLDDKRTVTLSRPLCKYPSYPKYKGKSDPSLATSFYCTTN